MKKPYLASVRFSFYLENYKFLIEWNPELYRIDFYVSSFFDDEKFLLQRNYFVENTTKPSLKKAKAFLKKNSPLWTWFEDYQKALTDKYRPLYIQQFRRVARLAYANFTKQEAKNLVQETRESFLGRFQRKKSLDDTPPFFTWDDDELLKAMKFKIGFSPSIISPEDVFN